MLHPFGWCVVGVIPQAILLLLLLWWCAVWGTPFRTVCKKGDGGGEGMAKYVTREKSSASGLSVLVPCGMDVSWLLAMGDPIDSVCFREGALFPGRPEE